jgi:tRNA threonylcarbamoyladenosine biosynthesis protein TsaB
MILDTSTIFLYVAFLEDGKLLYERMTEGKNNHSEHFLETIRNGLKDTNLEAKDFDRFAVGIGPGSYTGLRISLTVAKILAWTLKKPLDIISSLDLLGSGYLKKDGCYAITSIAKKGHCYGKLIEVKGGIAQTLIDDVFMPREQFMETVKDHEYKLIDESNFSVDYRNVKGTEVADIHSLSPNYLRREL